jgi:hypothetical protein
MVLLMVLLRTNKAHQLKGQGWRSLGDLRAALGDLQSDEVDIKMSSDWTKEVGPKVNLQVKRSLVKQSYPLQQPLLPPPTKTTTEDPRKEGTNLYLLPGVRINLSFSGVR